MKQTLTVETLLHKNPLGKEIPYIKISNKENEAVLINSAESTLKKIEDLSKPKTSKEEKTNA